VGYKNVTVNDNFFTGHFPERPIMPGEPDQDKEVGLRSAWAAWGPRRRRERPHERTSREPSWISLSDPLSFS
jgi:hypothetical protein